jgi:4-hydroxy-tetrahydrodipicolinate reductase
MGQAIAAQVQAKDDLELGAVWSRSPERDAGRFPAGTRLEADIEAVAAACDVLIDFSLPEGTAAVAAAVEQAGRPLVCGVSGLGDGQLAALEAAARRVPVVFDRNMSQGIAVLSDVVERVARALGDEFRVTIDETHHVHKLDAPSGTALKLGEAVAAARGRPLPDLMWYDEPGEPPEDAIRFLVERRGEVPGDHGVRFESATETLALTHSVRTRTVFADGALRAARWVPGQKAGLYSMRDVLGLSADSNNPA